MTFANYAKQLPDEIAGAVRSAVIALSIIGIVLGVVALVWPRATLVVIAVLFGIALIVTGVYRLYLAFAASLLPTSWRVVTGILGGLIVVVGIMALANPADSLYFLAIFIGVGWIFDGAGSLVGAFSGSQHAPKALAILSGVLGILAGIVMIAIPGLGISTVVLVGAIMLIVISIVNLLTLPRKVPDAQQFPQQPYPPQQYPQQPYPPQQQGPAGPGQV